ncbi:MAG TPA: serine/threonine-protein kinase [Polyangiales bacterium]|nr:serine/threonine-protein kinase [Polyangiales bacterium]
MKRSYRVLARLGEGGMATVYLAMIGKAGGFRKLVALKVLRDQPGVDERELRESFAREARVSARCQHRNVVQILDVCELDGRPALCMEYLDGQTYRQLRARATKVGTLPLFEQLRILAEAAHGLHHVHTLKDYEGRPLGLVHCDVSPENLFITYDGQVKLLDFGIAKFHGDEAPPGFRGKLSYLAPEAIKGETVDARADVFALGAMLWEAVCAVPFAGGPTVDDITKLRNRLTGAEGKIRGIEPSAPEALIQIVDRAIALEPAQRFTDAATFAHALEAYLQLIGAQPSAQSLSRLIIPLFTREAAKLSATIEPQLALSERWDRELDVKSPRGHSIVTFGKRADPPDAPFDFGLEERISFEPMPSVSTASDFASPADTVVPWRDNLERMKRYAPLLAVILAGVIGGAVLGLRDRTPQLVANPASMPDARPAAAAPPPRVEPPAPAVAPPCVEAPAVAKPAALPVSVEPRRTSASDERRARRHQERRLRRRAAQCAAGRLEKCDPV